MNLLVYSKTLFSSFFTDQNLRPILKYHMMMVCFLSQLLRSMGMIRSARDCYPLSSTPQLSVGTHMRCSCFYTMLFPSHLLLYDFTILEKIISDQRGTNPVTRTILNPFPNNKFWTLAN